MNNYIIISRQTTVKYLFALLIILVAVSLLTQALIHIWGFNLPWQLVTLLDLDSEQNLPSWFASTLFLINAVCCAVLYQLEAKRRKIYWLVLSCLLLIMAADEAASLHERTSEPINLLLNSPLFFPHSWVLIGLIIVALAVIYLRRFFLSLPIVAKGHMSIGVTLFFLGALGIETVGGWYSQHYGYNFSYALLVTIEEGLELLGLTFFLSGLLSYLDRKKGLIVLIKK